MIVPQNDITPLKKIFLNSETFSWKTYLLSIIAVCLYFALAHRFGMELYAFLAIIGGLLVWIMLHYPKIWIYCVLLSCTIFLKQTDATLDATDIFAAIMLNLSLIIWYISKIITKTGKILHTTSKQTKFKDILAITSLSEKLLAIFYVFLLLNSIVAYTNGVPLFEWIREYMLYILILYCFPMIEYFKTKRDWVAFLIILGLVNIFLDIKQLYNCYLVFSNITYAFQMGGTVRTNQSFYSSTVIAGIVFLFFAQKKKSKVFAFLIVVSSTIAIITTFSRGFWGAIIICIFLFLLFLSYKQILQLCLIVLLSFGIMFVCVDTLLPRQSELLQKFIVKRFASSTQGRKDISVRTRLYESEVVLAKIKESPIAGHGLRSQFSRYFSISKNTITGSFVHNGYLNLAHKAGIPMSALFHITMGWFTIRGLCNAWKLKRKISNADKDSDTSLYLAMSICGALSLILCFITSFITTSFYMRDASIPTAISIAFIHAAEQKLKNINAKNLDTKTEE